MADQSLSDDLTTLARRLLDETGAQPTEAARRRAISTAYYAVFHALCRLCADSLVGDAGHDFREAIYRTVEHGPARKLLTSSAARTISSSMREIGGNFTDLQQSRHSADYRPWSGETTPYDQAEATLRMAERTLLLLSRLDERERLALSVLLISRPRAT